MSWKDYHYKSPEELAKEKEEQHQREKELQETRAKLRDEISRGLEEIDKSEDVKLALEHLNEPDKIAQHINSNPVSNVSTHFRLSLLSRTLSARADWIDLQAETDDKPKELLEPILAPRLRAAGEQFQRGVNRLAEVRPRSKEGNELRELTKELDKQAEYYFNNRKGLGDDDPNATPLTLFNIPRIEGFLPQLPDEARYAYLLKMERSYLRQDEKGRIYRNGALIFPEKKEFLQQLKILINDYKEITAVQGGPTFATQTKAEASERNPDFTMRRRVLALLLLTFGRLELPEDLKKETVAEFFHFLTGNSLKNISDLLANPTQTAGTQRSIKNLCSDLHFVRDQFSRLGISDAVNHAMSEIACLLAELEKNSD